MPIIKRKFGKQGPHRVQSMGFEGLWNILDENKRVYELLSPDEKSEVDEFNARIANMHIEGIIEECSKQPDGKHPFDKYREKYKRKT